MIVGIGLDLVEMERLKEIIASQPRFAKRILTEAENEIYINLSERRKLEFLAGRFAAKEACSKAFGTGIGKELGFHDIEILNDEKGKPVLTVNLPYVPFLSITHTEHYAAAQVVLQQL
ncbi:holo-ACP synthase [Gottfriedia luciferensis]|uniref:holo-ACP synthase n=1 Tax=Gottfriedia luciferensis TaxID=178774 RepID=UPI000B438EB3|nr:holo-ACP synthase [Gottfriedia luciferensis]